MFKIRKITFALILCAGFLLTSCGGDSDDSSGSGVTTDDTATTDDDGSDDDNDDVEVLPDVSGVTGFNQEMADLTDWELVFEDDFSETLSNWNVWTGGAFNEELQHYQESNLSIDNGYLYIHGKRESVTGDTTPFDPTSKSFDFTSGRIESKQLYSAGNTDDATKLRISARILLPEGEGLWPAFWSFGDPWPTQGEIDILEFRGNDSDTYVTNFFYGTTANIPLTDPGQTTFDVPLAEDVTQNWHVFELVWSEMTFEIYFDGELVHTFTEEEWGYIDDVYSKSEKIVLNMAIGGVFFNGQNLVETNIPDSSYTIVDWVRVYKQ